ncbi:MAG: glycogen/starch/alpha-glucan phosphorylase, partial [Chitinivibrionales bacterium]|nr:glycogen/starch/alpha-glucan phosphorylase [Chitinivibrionales bacterium]
MNSIPEYYRWYLRYFLAKNDTTATVYDRYLAFCYAVRSCMMEPWIETQKQYHQINGRRIYYLSTEYVLGKSLKQFILYLNLTKQAAEAAGELNFSLEELYEIEDSCELGNGGRGRMAAAILDAVACAKLPGIGYGLRYNFALFQQKICSGM